VLQLAAALKNSNRRVLLVHRENEGHRTNYRDARTILEFVLAEATDDPEKPS